MKKQIIIFVFIICPLMSYSQNRIAISDNGTQEAHPSAILELISDDKGMLIPRMDTDMRNNISNPAESLIIFNTETNCIEIYVNGEWNDFWCHIPPECELEGQDVTFNYRGSDVTYKVVGGHNGTCWLDRNLGASTETDPIDYTGYDDEDAYGDLFQWGRLDDGHQNRESCTLEELSNSNNPGHSCFITVGFDFAEAFPYDWRDPQNNGLWQGVDGINNPCPDGWRLPTMQEWENEINSWDNKDHEGAFDSSLRLSLAGGRLDEDGGEFFPGSFASYWSSDIDEHLAVNLNLSDAADADIGSYNRASGGSVRCIKN